MTFPALLWILFLFIIPSILVITFAFRQSDLYGAILPGWSFDTLSILKQTIYLKLLWRTFWMSLVSAAVVIAISIPVGYTLARLPDRIKNIALFLVIVPFWSSFLIRIFAWKSLLHPEGFMHEILASLHLIDPHTTLLYNKAAVVLVMIYAYLPFGILPIYAAAAKFEWQLLEAAVDLGCSNFRAFCKVFIPGIRRGVITALIMVFIPAMGAYVIPDLVGSPSSELLSNKIVQKTLIVRNIPEASALALMLAVAILLPIIVIFLFQKRPLGNRAGRSVE